MQSDNKITRSILPVAALITAIIIAFVLFTHQTRERTIEQNAIYVEDSVTQNARHIDRMLLNMRNSISSMAYVCSNTMDPAEINKERLDTIAENSYFMFLNFIDDKQQSRGISGSKLDVSQRRYYLDGMNGNVGIDVIFDSTMSDETLVVFYSPVKNGDKVSGVLVGYCNESQMRDVLSASFFGETSETYLCMDDGSIIAQSTNNDDRENIFDTRYGMTDEEHNDLIRAFENHEPKGFTYQGSKGRGNAYVTKLSNVDWMLMQTFPSTVTSRMVSDANRAGFILESILLGLFAIYIAAILISARRKQKAILKENQKFTSIVDGVTNLFTRFIVVDLENNSYEYLRNFSEYDVPKSGVYTDMHHRMIHLYRYDANSTVNPETVFSKEYLQQHLDANTPYLQFEYMTEDGKHWDNVSVIAMSRENGVSQTVLFAIQDITDLKREELRTRTALQEAYNAADFANHAKSDFLSRMSHDIRTPMNAVMGMTAIAAMHLDDTERVRDCLNKITISSRHLLGLINEILDMSKIESGKFTLNEEEIDLSSMIDDLLTIMHPQIAAKNQHLKINVTNITHEKVIGDSMRIQQVFVNIMGNAVKFTPEGGNIVMTLTEKPSGVSGSGCYEFIFEDTGIGMSKDFIGRIFEPFARASDSRTGRIEGSGLGMPIAQNIVRLMNGDIKVESELGKGSKFTVTLYLPLCGEDSGDISHLKDLSVLVVDDDQITCENACDLLASIGMQSEWVTSGDDAIERLTAAQEANRHYAAVILDWKMPGKDGVQTAREIRHKINKDIPIIILSAYDWSAIEHEARAAGVNAFITKPLFKSRLTYVMKNLVTPDSIPDNSDVNQLRSANYENKRILLVEDNQLNMEIAEEILSTTGVTVEKAYDGKEAVDKIMAMPENYYDLIYYDAILMDIRMPNMNGYEATSALRMSEREDLKKIPIIAMTANAFSDDVYQSKAVGMNEHISKPIDISTLLKVLDTWLK